MSEFWKSLPTLREDLQRVKDIILRQIQPSPEPVRTVLAELVESNGKLLRPAFVLLAAGFSELEPEDTQERIRKVGAGVEMLHMATLVHDDLLDGSPTRRGVPAVHVRKGPKSAVLIGDYLFTRSFVLLAENASTVNAKRLSRVVSRICTSEIEQAEDRFDPSVTVGRYLRRIMGKIAALFAISFYVGAVEGGCPPALANNLRKVGFNLGMGFQIIDDILDFVGTPDRLGKPVGQDLRDGSLTLPVILALTDDDGELAGVLTKPEYSDREIEEIVRMVVARGGVEQARSVAARYTRRARREIDALPAGLTRDALHQVAARLLEREY
jgi:heptaprenyl diphosphate synthase